MNFSDHLPLTASIICSTSDQKLTAQKPTMPKQKYIRWDHADIDSYYYYTGLSLHPLSALDQMSLCTDTLELRNNIDSIYDSVVGI